MLRLRPEIVGALLLLAQLLAVGCGTRSGQFRGEFQALSAGEVPADLLAVQEQMGAAPGLLLVSNGPVAYLLVCAGRVEGGGYAVEVLDVTAPAGPGKEVRVLAALRPRAAQGEYPCAALRLGGSVSGLQFKARLSSLDGEVMEMRAVEVADR